MGSRYLIDSNVVIDFLAGKLPKQGHAFVCRIIDEGPNISVITIIEILGFTVTPDVQDILLKLITASLVFSLTEPVVINTIELRKQLRIKIPDAIIAATALTENMVLVTHNTADFVNISGLSLVDPWGK